MIAQQLVLELKPLRKKDTLIEVSSPERSFAIESRRFLGNKFKLLRFIKEVVNNNCSNINSICDIFAGTGVVGHYLSTPRNKVIFNDFLKSCIIPIRAFSATTRFDSELVNRYIQEFNNLETREENYFSIHFGNKYFTRDIARKIGAIRELIERLSLNEAERNILLTSLLYAADRIANTVGHYDAYTKVLDTDQKLELRPLEIDVEKNKNNEVYEEDANALTRGLKIDLLYLDPPYNSRQYSDTYHLLENLVRWEKPKVFGKAAKMDRAPLKSKYCQKKAYEAFEDLVNTVDCRYILMSYNNTGERRDQRSNARISEEQITSTLERRGRVEVFEKKYKEFTSGKSTQRTDHKEKLYFCEVLK